MFGCAGTGHRSEGQYHRPDGETLAFWCVGACRLRRSWAARCGPTIGRLWTMLAHVQGQPLNIAQLASSLAVSAPTIANYVDILCDMGLVRRLQPWFGNVGKRLGKSPKTYIRNSGLLHALLGLELVTSLAQPSYCWPKLWGPSGRKHHHCYGITLSSLFLSYYQWRRD